MTLKLDYLMQLSNVFVIVFECSHGQVTVTSHLTVTKLIDQPGRIGKFVAGLDQVAYLYAVKYTNTNQTSCLQENILKPTLKGEQGPNT